MADPRPQQKMTPKELMIVIVIALGSFMAGLDATIVNIALPDIAKYFDISTVLSSWVLNAYLIILVSLLLAASRLGDMKGYRNIFLGGFALFTAGSALCGLSPTIDILILSRMVQAVGGAVIAALGPVVGGFLTSAFSWQYIFFVNLPVGIIAIILGIHILPQMAPVAPKAKLDILGVLLTFVALGSLIVGLTSIQGNYPTLGIVALVISAIFWLLFIVQERRAAEPLVNTSLFANRAYSLQNVNVLLIQMAMAGVMVIMPFYLELVKKIPTDNAGAILLALPVGMILTAPIAGKLSDIIGTKKPIITGFAICAVALFLLSTISAHTSVGHIVIYLFLLGAGTGVAYSPLSSAVMGECPAKDRGSTSGLVKMMTNLGSSLGVAVVMLVAMVAAGPKIAQVSSHALPATELAGAFDAAFLFCMVLEIIGVVLMLAVSEKEPSGDSDGEVAIGF